MEELHRKRHKNPPEIHVHSPSKIARSAKSGFDRQNWGNDWKLQCSAESTDNELGEEEGSPPLQNGSGAGIGCGSGSQRLQESRHRVCGFTHQQLKELELQTLIHKHLEARTHVPSHLIHLLLRSTAVTCVADHPRQLLLDPIPDTAITECEFSDADKDNIELEPGRCRRSNEKKWRCGEPVSQGRTQCKRHCGNCLRGSRKLVEKAAGSSQPCASTRAKNAQPCGAEKSEAPNLHDSDTSLSISL